MIGGPDLNLIADEIEKTTEAQKRRDFWCIVAFIEIPGMLQPTGVCPVICQSEDALAVDLLPEVDWFDAGGDRVWCKDKQPGIYKLRLRPWAHGPDTSGEYDSGIDAYEALLLYEFKPDDLK